MMEFRFPDDPKRAHVANLSTVFAQPGWIAQPKRNGWRRVGYKEDGAWTFHAKRDSGPEARKPLPPDLLKRLQALPIPDGTALDMEWMGTRDVFHTGGKHWLEAFDIHYWNFQWQGDVPLSERLRSLADLIAICEAQAGTAARETLVVIPVIETGFLSWYNRLADEFNRQSGEGAITEGLVVKRADGRLVGCRDHCMDNPGWHKVKYREG